MTVCLAWAGRWARRQRQGRDRGGGSGSGRGRGGILLGAGERTLRRRGAFRCGQLAVTVVSCCLSSGVSVSLSEACWGERGYSEGGDGRKSYPACLQQNRVNTFFIWFKVQMGRMQPVVTASKDPFLHQPPSSAPLLSSAAEQSCYPIFNSRYNERMQPVVMAPKKLSTKPRTTEEKPRQKTRGKQIETYTGRAMTSCAKLG